MRLGLFNAKAKVFTFPRQRVVVCSLSAELKKAVTDR